MTNRREFFGAKTRLTLKLTGLVLAMCLTVAYTLGAFSDAQVSTDKTKYSVGEGMIISGTGFTPNAMITVSVLRPDHLTDMISPPVVTDQSGAFTTPYAPPSIPGRYKITATDGANSATTASTEADAIGYNKAVYNKSATAPNDTTGTWTSGNAGNHYLEEQWAYYQYQIQGVPTIAAACTGTEAACAVPSFDVDFNHFQSAKNTLYVDSLANFRVCVDCDITDSSTVFTKGPSQGLLLDTLPYPPSGDTLHWAVPTINPALATPASSDTDHVISAINQPFTSGQPCPSALSDALNTPGDFHCFHVSGRALSSQFETALKTARPDGQPHLITVFYAAHLAASFVWLQGTEAKLGCIGDIAYVNPYPADMPNAAAYGTNAYNPGVTNPCLTDANSWTLKLNGVGFASGSSRQFQIDNQTAGSNGALTLPIPTVLTPDNHIIITKVTNPASAVGAVFPYSGTLGPFNLDTDPNTTTPATMTFNNISGGILYTVTEGATPSWNLSNLTCALTGGTSTGGSFTTSGATANITFGPTDSAATVTCTYTNGQLGTIIVKKTTVPSGGTGFTFTGDAHGTINDGGTITVNNLAPGTYTSTESAKAGWSLTDITCSAGGSGNLTTGTATFSVNAGDNITCTFTNTQPDARITLTPATATNPINQQHVITATVQQNTGSGFVAAPNGTTVTFSLQNNTANASFVGGVNTCTTSGGIGQCTVTINGTQAGGVDTRGTTTFSVLGVSLTRTTNDGVSGDSGDAHKTYVSGTIIIDKVTNPAADPTLFTFTPSYNGGATFQLADQTTPKNSGQLAPGSYTVVESAQTGWVLTNLVCVDPTNNSSVSLTSGTATIALGAGETVTCTFTNTQLGTIIVQKATVPAGGTGFTFTGDAAGTINGGGTITKNLLPGTYTSTESAKTGWDLTGLSCTTDGSGSGATATFNLHSGETITCTFTNTQRANLVVQKTTVGGIGTFGFTGSAAFNLTTTAPGAAGRALTSAALVPSFTNIVPGPNSTKTVEETAKAGWISTPATCQITVSGTGTSGFTPTATGGASVTLGAGDTVTCGFVNTLQPTLTIIKNVNGLGTDTFTFPVSGANTLTPSIKPGTNPGTGTYGPVPINIGSSTISENTPPAGWTLTDASCSGYTGGGTGAGPLDPSTGVPTSWNFIANYGDQVVCMYNNSNAQATRTQGFWATHTNLANNVWNGTHLPVGSTAVVGSGDEFLCGVLITANPTPVENVLMGGFWSNISQMSGKGGKRSAIDQARMQVVQQYLAALLNNHMFGSGIPKMFKDARDAYCGSSASAIQTQIGILGAFNSQGDNLGLTPGGSATSQTSKAQADLDAWDTPQYPGLNDTDDGLAKPSLTLNKVVTNIVGTASASDFTLKATCTAGPCTLADNISGPGPSVNKTLTMGTYVLSETADLAGARYAPSTPWTCTNTGLPLSTFTLGPTVGGTATLFVGQGAVLSCSITNTQ
jgi:hypothetical protein